MIAPDRRASGVYDEAFSAAQTPRPHWAEVLRQLQSLGGAEMSSRAEDCRRILGEHGVTYPSPGRTDGAESPWELDLLPLVIPADEWDVLDAALIQRARLLNRVLRDLHGNQRLVRDGFLPAPLVYANPGYLRACQALLGPDQNHLHMYAADLVRTTDGGWCVLADRTQSPAGLGFAFENRTILSRVLPEAMQAVGPRSLSRFMRMIRDSLTRLARRSSDNPTIVLLTPGPRNEAYFEHAYLARHLGFTLVEGGDLTVRDRCVFIKTLEGLRRVDVILRRVGDAWCDPLELRGDSLLGVPGLVEAARAGNVAIANALGSGLLESPAFLPFLPGLCRHLFGEELRLPSIATWWCGQMPELNHVKRHAEHLAIRPAYQLAPLAPANDGTTGSSTGSQLGELEVRAHEFIGQDPMTLSHAPVWNGHGYDYRGIVLRAFVLIDGDNLFAIPGGLARTLNRAELPSTAMALGGGSKDVWVLSGNRGESTGIMSPVAPAPAGEYSASDLPSRVVDNFFWLGRYTERLEHLVRIVRCVIGRIVDESLTAQSPRLGAMAELLARLKLIPAVQPAEVVLASFQREVLRLLYEIERKGGVRPLLTQIQQAGFAVRDRLSADTWRILNRLIPDARPQPGQLPLVHASSVLNRLVLDLGAFSGMEMENMTRGHGWVFLDLGRRLERGGNLAAMVGASLQVASGFDPLLEPLLEIADSVITYRRRHFAEPRLPGVLDLLARDDNNPRSIAFQLAAMLRHAEALPLGPNPAGVSGIRDRIRSLAVRPGMLLPPTGAPASGAFDAAGLGRHLETLAAELGEVSERVTQVYFSHVVPQVN